MSIQLLTSSFIILIHLCLNMLHYIVPPQKKKQVQVLHQSRLSLDVDNKVACFEHLITTFLLGVKEGACTISTDDTECDVLQIPQLPASPSLSPSIIEFQHTAIKIFIYRAIQLYCFTIWGQKLIHILIGSDFIKYWMYLELA